MSSSSRSASLSDTGLFYFPEAEIEKEELVLNNPDEINHINRVLRKKSGDQIFITDGRGNRVKGTIKKITPKELILENEESIRQISALANHTIVIPLLKNPDRMEFALEKCIELGFVQFAFCKFTHSERSHINLERMSGKAVSAMKQSLNCNLPKLTIVKSMAELVSGDNKVIWFDLNAESGLISTGLDPYTHYSLVIGPEGGFSDEERTLLKGKSAPLLLGNTRLRAETAVISAASIFANKVLFL